MKSIGVYGLGQMGLPVALAVGHAGMRVNAHDPSAQRRALADAQGVATAAPPMEAGEFDGLVSVLPSDEALRALCHGPLGVLKTAREGAVHLCMGTIGVDLAGALDLAHHDAGLHFVACPVFGRPDEAWAADLTAVLGFGRGSDEATRRLAADIVGAVAPRVYEVASPQAACAIKLAGNLMIASAIETMTEAFGLAHRYGASARLLQTIVTSKLFAGPVYEGVGARVAASTEAMTDGPVGFTVALGLKDLSLLAHAGETAQWSMPVADAVHARLSSLVRRGQGQSDWADLPQLIAAADADFFKETQ